MRPEESLGALFVKEARTWINTRWQHQGRVKGVGVDCVGFIEGTARGAGVDIEKIPADYQRTENGSEMLRLLSDHMDMVPFEETQMGDIWALCDDRCTKPDVPRHLVIVTEVRPNTFYIIHASEAGVREHRTDTRFIRRIHSCWRLKV